MKSAMKNSLLMLSICLIVILGCDDTFVNPTAKSPVITYFDGKFVNWNKGNDHRILFLGAPDIWNSDKIYASSIIDSNGNFFMSNFDSPSEAWLQNPAYPTFINGLSFKEYTLVCSDSNAKVVYGELIIVKDTSNWRVAEVYRQNFSYNYYINEGLLKHGDFITNYIYADRDVNLTGKIKYTYSDSIFHREANMTYNYNLYFKKGWNQRITYIVSNKVEYNVNKTVITREIKFINYEPFLADWYYYYY